MDISLPIIYALVTGIAIGAIAVVLFQRHMQKPLTLDEIKEAAALAQPLSKQLFDAALIGVHFLEQISKPAAPGLPPKMTNEQKKAKAVNSLKVDFPDAPVHKIDEAVEAAVHVVKRVNWNS